MLNNGTCGSRETEETERKKTGDVGEGFRHGPLVRSCFWLRGKHFTCDAWLVMSIHNYPSLFIRLHDRGGK